MRSVTVAEIFRRARKKADMTYSGFFSDQDMFDLLNSSYTELYDLLVQAFQNYYAADPPFVFNLVPGQSKYDLPSDFYKMITCEEILSPTQSVIIFPFNELERNSVVSTDTGNIPATEIRIRYIPAPPVFSDLAEEIDGVSGWDDLIVTDMAIAMLEAEESPTDALQARKNRLIDRIKGISPNRDVTIPGTVTDVTAYSLGLVQNTLQYRFYGNQIEFLAMTYLGV